MALGFGLGGFCHGRPELAANVVPVIQPIGDLWVNALKVAVLPLVLTLIVCGVAGLPLSENGKRWTVASALVFLGLLVVAAIFALAVGVPYVSALGPKPETTVLEVSSVASGAVGTGFGDWLAGLIPSHGLAAMASGDMLPVVVLALMFGLAMRQIAEEKRKPILQLAEGIRDVVLVFVGWVVKALPIGVFCLSLAFASKLGLEFGASVLHFMVYTCVALTLFTFLLGILASVFGRVPWSLFSRSVAPAQAVAIGTRSSLASLPALFQGARALGLPDPAHEIVLPMAAALLKVNRPISAVSKLLFCAAMFGVTLSPLGVLTFVLTVFLLSLATPGVPSAGSKVTLGAYMAAGLPAEGILLLDATDSITDIFKTVCNVTGNFASATLASRFATRGTEGSE
ncbi:MAG: cation:dicarboxylase symporter family transporter [Armatimonadetes bacterium]|nr:cation:dicarboxylase symporter family transporter [Armatimonadota bacterium]